MISILQLNVTSNVKHFAVFDFQILELEALTQDYDVHITGMLHFTAQNDHDR
jgi:hypothetical protein